MALAAAVHRRPIVVIVYMTVLYDPNVVLAAIREELPDVPIVGSSTQGIARIGAVSETDRVLGVAVICSDVATASVASAKNLSQDAFKAGRSVAEQLGDPSQLGETPLLVWFDPLTGANAQGLIDGLAAGGYAQVLGGAAGQPWGPFDKTYQYVNLEALNDGVVALELEGLGGAVWETSHGVEPLGLDVTVTEAEGNVIRKLDGKPALDVWSEQLLGTFTSHVDDWTWVLGVRVPGADPNDPEGLVSRGVFGINKDTKEITLLAPVPVGSAGAVVRVWCASEALPGRRKGARGELPHPRIGGGEHSLAGDVPMGRDRSAQRAQLLLQLPVSAPRPLCLSNVR